MRSLHEWKGLMKTSSEFLTLRYGKAKTKLGMECQVSVLRSFFGFESSKHPFDVFPLTDIEDCMFSFCMNMW